MKNSKIRGSKKGRKKKQTGFTLIEILFTAVILLSVLGAFAYAIIQSLQLIGTMQDKDIALNAIQEKIEEIAHSDISKIIENYNNKTFSASPLSGPSGKTDIGKITVTRLDTTNLYDVKLSVTWQQKTGRTISQELKTTFVLK